MAATRGDGGCALANASFIGERPLLMPPSLVQGGHGNIVSPESESTNRTKLSITATTTPTLTLLMLPPTLLAKIIEMLPLISPGSVWNKYAAASGAIRGMDRELLFAVPFVCRHFATVSRDCCVLAYDVAVHRCSTSQSIDGVLSSQQSLALQLYNFIFCTCRTISIMADNFHFHNHPQQPTTIITSTTSLRRCVEH